MIETILNVGRKIIPKKLFKLGQPFYHFLLALSGNIFYRFPGKKIICVGVTGTNGKSTTVELINSVLKESSAKTGMLSTIAIEIAGERKDNTTNRTTLGRWQTPKLLREMIKKGCRYAIIEVASEGIVQFRTWGIPFDIAVYTNLSPEHLNTHKTMGGYRNTKGKLFLNLATSTKKKKIGGKNIIIEKISIVNADDREAGYFSAFPADKQYLYGLTKGNFKAVNIKEKNGLEFIVKDNKKEYQTESSLIGIFNIYNILAAWAVGLSQGVESNLIASGIKKVSQVKGRLEKVAEKNGAKFYIDYAVTPESFELLFKELRKKTTGKIIAVFGATGDRDKAKRPKLGETAAKYTDIAIITDEEPYSEDPNKIIDEVAAGAKKGKARIIKITDRKKALTKAAEIAEKGDVVVATGMGHQKYRNIGGNKKISWDEAEVIKGILKKRSPR
jgi:UDP-N-acetylmuramoyl-L-alanyl-D-glutamate--2,6-diaminopimelate ligase